MKDKLIKAIREVPISGKTYEEYVEALADKLIFEGCIPRTVVLDDNSCIVCGAIIPEGRQYCPNCEDMICK